MFRLGIVTLLRIIGPSRKLASALTLGTRFRRRMLVLKRQGSRITHPSSAVERPTATALAGRVPGILAFRGGTERKSAGSGHGSESRCSVPEMQGADCNSFRDRLAD